MSLASMVRLYRNQKNLGRMREILFVLVRYGFTDVVARLGGLRLISRVGRLFRLRRAGRQARAKLSTERRIRLVLQELGPTFVKFGQILANRPDVVPPGLVTELKYLQDQVKPFSNEAAEAVIQREFGRPSHEIFSEFAAEPIASASIAQVHRARLQDGTAVAVKIRRPDIERPIDSDLAILRAFAESVARGVPELARFDPEGLVNEFARSLRRELDFQNELYHLQRFRLAFADESRLVVPRPYPELCSSAVLVMEYVEGHSITDREALEAEGVDIPAVVRIGMEMTLRAIFEHRFFHADPHPGNFFVLADGRLCLLDFGIMGFIAEERLDHLLAFLYGALTRDVSLVITALYDMGVLEDMASVPELKVEIDYLLGRYGSLSLGQLEIMALLESLFDLFFRFDVKPPADLLLVIKTLSILEGVGREVFPDFSPMTEMRAYVIPFFVERSLDSRYHARRGAAVIMDSLRALQQTPRRLDRVLQQLEQGRLQFNIAPDVLRQLGEQRRVSTARLVLTASMLLTGFATTVRIASVASVDGIGVAGIALTTFLLGASMFSVFRPR